MPAASASTSSVRNSVAALVALALLVGGGVAFLLHRQRAAEAEAVARADAEIAAERAAAQRQEEERERNAAARSTELEAVAAENERLKQQLAAAAEPGAVASEQASEALREGLSRVITELSKGANRRPPAAQTAIRVYHGPVTYVTGNDVRAWGNVKNFGGRFATARLKIVLYRDGNPLDQRVELLDLDPDEDYRYEVEFPGVYDADHELSAEAVLE